MELIIEINPESNETILDALNRINTFIQDPSFSNLAATDDYGVVQIEYLNINTGEELEDIVLNGLGDIHIDSECSFYAQACQQEKNLLLIEDICKNIIVTRKKHGRFCALYSHEEVTFGLYPAFLLALQNKKYIPVFINMIKTFDMDHEVYESSCILSLVDKYGACDEILVLLAVRMVTCGGQHGFEDMGVLQKKYKLDDFFTDATVKEKMAGLLITELKESHFDSWIDMLSEEFSSAKWPNLSVVIIDVRSRLQSP